MNDRRRVGLAMLPIVVAAVVLLIAVEPSDSAVARAAAPEERGSDVYRQHCAMCHGSDATGMMGMHPALRGAVDRLSREGVEVTIRRGRSTTPPMPSFEERLSDGEIRDVIAYIDSLPGGPRNFGSDGNGMGGGMGDMMGRAQWGTIATVVLAALLAGLVG